MVAMQVNRDLAKRVARLERLLGRRMGARRGDLRLRVKRLRGQLPEPVRQDLLRIDQARRLSGHPRIARQMDMAALAQAERRAVGFLRGPVLRERRVTRRLRWLGGMVLNIALIVAGATGLAVWQGLV